MGKFISNITMEQATIRVKFDKTNPTNLYKRETKDYQNELTKHDEDFNKAFLLLETLQHAVYILYLEDPLGEGKLEKSLDLFCFKPLEDQFHVPQDSDAYDEIKNKNPPNFICPPFMPSIASNEIDVGKEFSKNSKFNPDTVNTAILTPTVYAYIMSAYSVKSLPAVMNNETKNTRYTRSVTLR